MLKGPVLFQISIILPLHFMQTGHLRLAMGFLLLLCAVALCSEFVSGQVSLVIPKDGWTYKIQAWNSNCLVVRNWDTADNAITEFSVCDGDIALWTVKFIPDYPGKYNLVNKYTGKCLSSGTDLSGTENYTPVLQYTCSSGGSYAQLWWVDKSTQFLDLQNSVYTSGLRGNADKCLDWQDWFGGTTYLYDCDVSNVSHQRLHFVESSGPSTSD